MIRRSSTQSPVPTSPRPPRQRRAGSGVSSRSDVSQLIRGYNNIKVKKSLFVVPADLAQAYEATEPAIKANFRKMQYCLGHVEK
jgi:hypothetical protein